MGVPVLILGKSGSGKSRSIKGLANIGLIKVIEKELPFRNNLGFITTSNYDVIKQALLKSQTKSIVIDDAGYLLTNEYLFSSTKGYDKFTDIAVNFYELIRFITTTVPKDKIVYITMHEDEDNVTGQVKPKTIGKLLDEKVCVEGLFTIVLRCVDHMFYTNGSGCAKSPEDMFETQTIENNLAIVDQKIREYYNMEETENDRQN